MSGKPFRSKFKPFLGEIRQMRKSGSTWAEVVEHLGAVHRIKTNIPAVREFVLRQKRRPLPADLEPDEKSSKVSVERKPRAVELAIAETPSPATETASQRIRRERAERQRLEGQKGNFNFGSVYEKDGQE